MGHADAHPTSSSRRLKPVYRPSGAANEIVVYMGTLLLATANQEHTALGRLEMRLTPSPTVVARLIGDDALLGLQLKGRSSVDPIHVAIPPESSLDPPTPSELENAPDDLGVGDPSIWFNAVQAGRVEEAERFLLHISGPLRAMLPSVTVDDGVQPQLGFSLPGWNLTLASVIKPKRDTDFNFVIAAVPSSRPVDFTEVEQLRRRTFLLLSLLAGREVGVGPICGVDAANRVVWLWCDAPRLRAGESAVTWCPIDLVATALPALAEGFIALSDDKAMEEFVDRAINYLLAADGNEVIDIRVVMATTGLELISWAVLEERGWHDSEALRNMAAGPRARHMLQWADIPVAIPEAFRAVNALRSRVVQPDWEGPDVVFKIRNRLVHPPKQLDDPEWPDSDERIQGWQLATWYLELVVLRILGYNGSYRSRLRLGRWAGAVEPVPWAIQPDDHQTRR